MTVAVVLFTRDLRVHDNPALDAAARAHERVAPLFVVDPAIVDRFGTPNRLAFLGESLDDLDRSLGGLAIRRGDTVAETVRFARTVGADAVYLAEDASAFAASRERRLARALRVVTLPSTSIVPIGALSTSSGGSYRVFTPFWRAWRAAERRTVLGRTRIRLPEGMPAGQRPSFPGGASPDRPPGGETEGRKRMTRFLGRDLETYGELADDLAADRTSRLSPYLHFGCLSPLELAERAASSDEFVRQLCWRDFFLQHLAAYPRSAHEDFRPRRGGWSDDERALEAWREGLTGYPIVDAAMRQLRQEGWMHNRARLVVASFLTKTLGLDWRHGAAHFSEWLVDGDLSSNAGNWQWSAGTGLDTRPNRILNPLRQARRFDASGDYVRRYVPELAGLTGTAVHAPWRVGGASGYPSPIVDHDEPAARLRATRGR